MSAIRTSGGLKEIARISVRNAANVLKEVVAGHVRNAANVLKDFPGIGGLTVIASPGDAYGYGSSNFSIQITTGGVTASVIGGTAPYSYLWTTAFGQMEAVSPNSATTIFRSILVSPGDTASDEATCTVTDANGNTGAATGITLNASNFGT